MGVHDQLRVTEHHPQHRDTNRGYLKLRMTGRHYVVGTLARKTKQYTCYWSKVSITHSMCHKTEPLNVCLCPVTNIRDCYTSYSPNRQLVPPQFFKPRKLGHRPYPPFLLGITWPNRDNSTPSRNDPSRKNVIVDDQIHRFTQHTNKPGIQIIFY